MNKTRAIVVTLLCVCLLWAGCNDNETSSKPGELRVAVFGTTSELMLRTIAEEAFEHLTQTKVTFIGGTSRIHLQQMRNRKGSLPPFDVVLLDGIVQEIAAKEELLERASESSIPQMEHLLDQAQPRVAGGPAMYFYSVGILYNPKAFTKAGIEKPKSWGDFWNPKLKGHVAVPNIYHASGLDFVQAAASVAGKSRETLAGLKAGVDAIAQLEPALIYSAVEPLENALDEEQIWILPAYSYGAYKWIREGKDLAYVLPRERGFGHVTTINTVKNTSRSKLANKFINLVISQGFQYGLAIETPFGPVRDDVIEELSRFPKITERFPCGEEGFSKLYVPHWEELNKMRPSVEAYWFQKFPKK